MSSGCFWLPVSALGPSWPGLADARGNCRPEAATAGKDCRSPDGGPPCRRQSCDLLLYPLRHTIQIELPMQVFKNQILSGTGPDIYGETLSKAFLERACEHFRGRLAPVNREHGYDHPALGYIENLRVVPAADSNEWHLIGDVTVRLGDLSAILGGFSISGVEPIITSPAAEGTVLLPYPHYNDTNLIDEIASDPTLSIQKWIKRSADATTWALIGAAVTFAITPVWDDVYKRLVAPRIDNLVNSLLEKLRAKGLSSQLVQLVSYRGNNIEIRFIPDNKQEHRCLASPVIGRGIKSVVAFLDTDAKAKTMGIERAVLYFDPDADDYVIHRIEYNDGTVEHLVK